MTEYWVSNAKHHCKFCKCWLQGDKASIRHHENGSRHREAASFFATGTVPIRWLESECPEG